MSDFFANRYWPERFWAVHYFQGGEVDPNAMSASLSGSGSLTATATATGHLSASLSGSGVLTATATVAAADDTPIYGGWQPPPTTKKRKAAKPPPQPIPRFINASMAGHGRIADATLTAIAAARATITGHSRMTGTATASWRIANETFWLLAA